MTTASTSVEADDGEDRATNADEAPDHHRWTQERAAAWVFGGCVVVALPLLLHLGSFYWFFRDDWQFITSRELTPGDLFEDHNGHWVTLPVLAFRLLFSVVGLRSYMPYQAVVILFHLATITLVRVTMRRAGVGPWIATGLAAMLLVFGPGREDILWAFQIGYTGALAVGLTHLILTDRDGPLDRRDVLGLAVGAVAVTSTAVGVVMVAVVGLSRVLKGQWARAAFHTVPLAAIYGAWNLVVDPVRENSWGRPPISTTIDWVRSGVTGVLEGIGQSPTAAALVGLLLVVGLVLSLWPTEVSGGPKAVLLGIRARAVEVSLPLALLIGALAFFALAAEARWFAGPQAARASRFVYVGAVLMVPAIGVAAHGLAKRWRPLVPMFVIAAVATMPANIASFDDGPFGPRYHETRKEILTTIVRMPDVRSADPDLRPLADPFMGTGVDLEFLLWAVHAGKLNPSSGDVPPALRQQLLTRLALRQEPQPGLPLDCEPIEASVAIDPEPGAVVWLGGQTRVHMTNDEGGWGAGVVFAPIDGNTLTVQRDDIELRFEPLGGADLVACVATGP